MNPNRAKPRHEQSRPTISFRTHVDVLTELDRVAAKHGVSRNAVIEGVLYTYLKDRQRRGAIKPHTKPVPSPTAPRFDIFA